MKGENIEAMMMVRRGTRMKREVRDGSFEDFVLADII
jgi:hypothetical protein